MRRGLSAFGRARPAASPSRASARGPEGGGGRAGAGELEQVPASGHGALRRATVPHARRVAQSRGRYQRRGAFFTQRTVSRAISSSSFVGITKVRTRAPSALTSPSFPPTAASFFVRVEADAEEVHVLADPGADLGRVLADAAGEDDRVGAVHLGEVGARGTA